MKILIDIDNVICGFAEYFIEYLNLRYNRSYNFNDFIVWDFVYSDSVDLNIDQFNKAFDEFRTVGMWDSLNVYNDVHRTLEFLWENHDITYLTSRPLDAINPTIDFFNINNLPFNHFKFLENEEEEIGVGDIVFCPGLNKGEIGSFNKVDIAIEDQPKTIQQYINSQVNVVRRLQPYNDYLDFNDPDGYLLSCSNMKEFKYIVEKGDSENGK